MAKNPDYISKEIKTILLPALSEDGFGLYRPKDFIRVTDHFVDHIYFQLSRHGSRKFYIHYSKSLIHDPLLTLNSYSVGNRLSSNRHNDDPIDWSGETAEGAKDGIHSVLRAYEKTIKPWMDSIAGIPEYVFEFIATNRNASTNSFELLVAFLSLGRRNRPSWICDHYLESTESQDEELLAFCREFKDVATFEYQNEMVTNPKYEAYRDAFSQLPKPETTHKTVRELVNSWRETNIERFKLRRFIV